MLSEDSNGSTHWIVYDNETIIYEVYASHSELIEYYIVFTKEGRRIKDVRHVINYYPTTVNPG